MNAPVHRPVLLAMLAAAHAVAHATAATVPAPAPVPAPAAVPAATVTLPTSASPAASSPATAPPTEPLTEVVVSAPEPRYVAPTTRDRIGRIWAPVFLNGQGPFRLVLDTGASNSAVTPSIVAALNLATHPSKSVTLLGVTGAAPAPVVRIDSLRVGDLEQESLLLPVITDAFGGAEGVLGNLGLRDKRIFIDFRADRIDIRRSRGERAPQGMLTIPAQMSSRGLLMIPAKVGGIPTKAIIDTGGEMTIGNEALRVALEQRRAARDQRPDTVVGATQEAQDAISARTPSITLGDATRVSGARITFGDLYIFEHWRLTREPALMLGMDVLGMLDVLIIDYRRREVHVRLR
jgi:predicted aspartyl protease